MRHRRMLALALVAASRLVSDALAQDDAQSAEVTALSARADAAQGKEKAALEAQLGKLLEGQGRWSDAASAWRAARKARGDVGDLEGEARALLGFAEDVLARGDQPMGVAAVFEDARAALRRAREGGSKSVDVALGLARCAEIEGDAKTRIDELTAASAAAPDDLRPARALAAAHLAAGRTDEAIALFDRLSQAHPQDVELAIALYDAAKAASDEARQRSAAARAVAAAPDDGRGWTAMWRIYSPKQRWGELADAMAELVKAHPDGHWSGRYMGVACANARRFDEALVWLEKAWELNKKDAHSRCEEAKILWFQKAERVRAVQMYTEALAVEANGTDAYIGLYNAGVRYDAEGDKAAASKIFELLTKARPFDANARNNYANSLRFAGRYEECERTYRAAIEAFPADAPMRNDFALLLEVQGREAEAYVVLTAAHEIDPAFNDVMENLAYLARMKGDHAETLKWYRAAHAAMRAKGENAGKHRINVDDERWPLPPLSR